jgi:hypothetical protein
MIFERKSKRLATLATVAIPDAFSGEALLKDISVSGCRLEHTANIDIEIGSQYTITIRPEPASKIDGFDLLVEARWIEAGNCTCEAGFSIVESPKGKPFQRYVDYLDYKAIGSS